VSSLETGVLVGLETIFTLAYTIFRCVNQSYVKVMVFSLNTTLQFTVVFILFYFIFLFKIKTPVNCKVVFDGKHHHFNIRLEAAGGE
jgi:hypothetical protein